MSTSTAAPSAPSRSGLAQQLIPRLVGAALALAVAYVHVQDQDGFPGSKEPRYVGLGYYQLELAGLLVALGLLIGLGQHTRKVWLLAVGVAVGPIVGFVLSRGPGLPNYNDDKGNWTEPLGIKSLVIEGLLLVLAVGVLLRSRRAART